MWTFIQFDIGTVISLATAHFCLKYVNTRTGDIWDVQKTASFTDAASTSRPVLYIFHHALKCCVYCMSPQNLILTRLTVHIVERYCSHFLMSELWHYKIAAITRVRYFLYGYIEGICSYITEKVLCPLRTCEESILDIVPGGTELGTSGIPSVVLRCWKPPKLRRPYKIVPNSSRFAKTAKNCWI